VCVCVCEWVCVCACGPVGTLSGFKFAIVWKHLLRYTLLYRDTKAREQYESREVRSDRSAHVRTEVIKA
jgi:hypothetical protein